MAGYRLVTFIHSYQWVGVPAYHLRLADTGKTIAAIYGPAGFVNVIGASLRASEDTQGDYPSAEDAALAYIEAYERATRNADL